MILATSRIRVPPEKQEEIVRSIRRVLEPTRVEPGCEGIQCGRDIEDDNTLIIQEQWASRAEFERHVRSDDYRVMLSVLESANEEPDVQFHEVSETAGMEIIFEVREGKES